MTSRAPSWLSRNLLLLCGVSFLQDAASDLVYPLLPLFITGELRAPVAVVGIVEGVAEGIAALTKLGAGRVADRVRRRPLVALGYGLAAAGKLVVAAATVWPLVLAGRGVDRVGKGLRGAPRDALLVVGVPPERRGAAFGLHRAADTAGAVLGPLIGLALYAALGHRIRPLLWVALIPAVLSVALVFAVREGGEAKPRTRSRLPADTASQVALPSAYWRVLVVVVLFSVVNLPDALLLLRARAVGFSVEGVLVCYVVYNASAALLSFPAGALSDRLPRRGVFAVGLVFSAVATLGLASTHRHSLVLLLFVVYGAFAACTDGVGKAWASSVAPAVRAGSAQGYLQGYAGGGVLLAGVWGGLAWHHNGARPLAVAGVVTAVLAVLLLVAGKAWEGGSEGPDLVGPSTDHATGAGATT